MKHTIVGKAYRKGYEKGFADGLLQAKYSPYRTKSAVVKRVKKPIWEKVNCKNKKCGWFQKDKITGAENGHLINCPYDSHA